MNQKPLNSTYSVTVNGKDVLVSQEELDSFDTIGNSSNSWHVLQDETSFEAEVVEADFTKKKYKVKVNTNTYNVFINNTLDQLIKDLGFEIGATKQINEINAPMPGLILEIHVKIGQEVKENDPLLILEAMKMENVIVSPREGIIKSIAVEKGNAVDKNQLLIEFEL